MSEEFDWYDNMEMLKSEDFYFKLEILESNIEHNKYNIIRHYFYVTPKAHYDEEHCLLDTSIPMNSFPSGFQELSDSTFEYNGDPKMGRQLLLQAGFIEKDMHL